MKPKLRHLFGMLLIMPISILAQNQACVEFETLPLGQEYGNGHNAQGEVILTENDIDVSVEYFHWMGGGGTFGTCHVIDGTPNFNTGQAMWTNNINLKFDFSNFMYTVNWVSFDFHDSGGDENFSINDLPIFVGEYEVNWNADGFSSGIYFYQLRTGSDILSRKMLVE